MIKAFKAGVTPEGQKLFQTISKTIDDTDWNGENIVIMGKTTICPPYMPDNIKGIPDSKAFQHIRKIVEKFYSDQMSVSTPSASPEKTLAKSGTPPKTATPTGPPPSTSQSQQSRSSNGPNRGGGNAQRNNDRRSGANTDSSNSGNSRPSNGDSAASSAATSVPARKSVPKPM